MYAFDTVTQSHEQKTATINFNYVDSMLQKKEEALFGHTIKRIIDNVL